MKSKTQAWACPHGCDLTTKACAHLNELINPESAPRGFDLPCGRMKRVEEIGASDPVTRRDWAEKYSAYGSDTVDTDIDFSTATEARQRCHSMGLRGDLIEVFMWRVYLGWEWPKVALKMNKTVTQVKELFKRAEDVIYNRKGD